MYFNGFGYRQVRLKEIMGLLLINMLIFNKFGIEHLDRSLNFIYI